MKTLRALLLSLSLFLCLSIAARAATEQIYQLPSTTSLAAGDLIQTQQLISGTYHDRAITFGNLALSITLPGSQISGAYTASGLTISTTNRLLGRTASGAGAAQELNFDATLALTSGTLGVVSTALSPPWSTITATPTTMAGYGITDPIVLTSGSYANPSWITSLAWSKLTGTPTTLSGYGVTDGVRSVTITMPAGFTVAGSPVTGTGTIGVTTTLSGVVKGTGSGFTAATDGTDFVSPAVTATLTNKTISGASNTITIRLASDVTGTLPVANGGSGQTTAAAALTAFLPAQSGASGKVLQSNGTSASWQTPSGGATIDVYETAWLSPTGDDGTAVMGDPSHPYATAAAAFGAGGICLVLEPNSGSSYGTITTSSALVLNVVGYGSSLASVDIVVTGGYGASVNGNGASMVSVTVTTDGAAGSNGATGVDDATDGSENGGSGVNGGGAGGITIIGLHASNLSAQGGAGGTGGNGGDFHTSVDDTPSLIAGAGGNGGEGGSGGTLTATDCLLDNVALNAGASGNGGNGGNYLDDASTGSLEAGGAGGGGGAYTISNTGGPATFLRATVTAFSGLTGSPLATGGTGGNGCNSGESGAPGSDESAGSPSTVDASLSLITPSLSTGGYSPSYRLVIEAGVTIDTLN